MKHIPMLALLALVLLAGQAKAEAPTRTGVVIFRAPEATARSQAAQRWRPFLLGPGLYPPGSTGETSGIGCVATCLALASAACGSAWYFCTKAATVTLGGAVIPCAVLAIIACAGSAGATAYCEGMCR